MPVSVKFKTEFEKFIKNLEATFSSSWNVPFFSNNNPDVNAKISAIIQEICDMINLDDPIDVNQPNSMDETDDELYLVRLSEVAIYLATIAPQLISSLTILIKNASPNEKPKVLPNLFKYIGCADYFSLVQTLLQSELDKLLPISESSVDTAQNDDETLSAKIRRIADILTQRLTPNTVNTETSAQPSAQATQHTSTQDTFTNDSSSQHTTDNSPDNLSNTFIHKLIQIYQEKHAPSNGYIANITPSVLHIPATDKDYSDIITTLTGIANLTNSDIQKHEDVFILRICQYALLQADRNPIFLEAVKNILALNNMDNFNVQDITNKLENDLSFRHAEIFMRKIILDVTKTQSLSEATTVNLSSRDQLYHFQPSSTAQKETARGIASLMLRAVEARLNDLPVEGPKSSSSPSPVADEEWACP